MSQTTGNSTATVNNFVGLTFEATQRGNYFGLPLEQFEIDSNVKLSKTIREFLSECVDLALSENLANCKVLVSYNGKSYPVKFASLQPYAVGLTMCEVVNTIALTCFKSFTDLNEQSTDLALLNLCPSFRLKGKESIEFITFKTAVNVVKQEIKDTIWLLENGTKQEISTEQTKLFSACVKQAKKEVREDNKAIKAKIEGKSSNEIKQLILDSRKQLA